MSVQDTGPTPQRIMQFAFGYAPPLMLEAGVRLGIFDTLDRGAKTVEEVSRESGASVRGLRAVMNALVGLELLSRDTDRRYHLTPESAAFLVSGKPGWYGGILRHTSKQLLPKWLELTEIVRTGKPAVAANQEEEGAPFFHEFVEDIFPMSYPAAEALAGLLGVESAREPVRVLDIAAGSGVWGIALARKGPQVRVTAVDWPGVIDVTRRTAERMGVVDRFDFLAGNLMDVDYGTGHHIVTLGNIIHSEGERRSRQLLEKVYRAMAPGGTIAIAEMLTNNERTGPPFALIFAVNMLVNTEEGDTYSFEEIGGWLRDAGFVDARRFESPGPSPLILATKLPGA